VNEVGRAIDDGDRGRILAALTQWAASGSFYALRTRALILLVWGSALRLSEALALNIDQILEDPTLDRLGRIRGTALVRADQSKGRRKGPRRWNSSGAFVLTKPARIALREYLAECHKRGWVTLPVKRDTPLFVTVKGGKSKGAPSRERLGKRAAQRSWTEVQKRAKVHEHYRFHDLRHDALTRVGDVSSGNVFKVAQFGRLRDIRTAQRYVHGSTASLAELAELASMPSKKKVHA
jgi:integrase